MSFLGGKFNLLQRFEKYKYVSASHPGCWLWCGNHYENGYAQTSINSKPMRVSRIIAHLFHGLDLSSNCKALHKCDVKGCWNPDHIFVGTQAENIQDCVAKGRHSETRKTHCKRGHLLNGTNLYIHSGKRSCKICRKAATYRCLGIEVKQCLPNIQ